MANDIVLSLAAKPGNPRNSEGSFVNLANGDILFAYSRYTGDSWQDHGAADIAGRYSHDGGLTWSQEDQLIVANEGDCNVMSVSLLRLQDGRIALFYVQKNSARDCRLRMRISMDEAVSWGESVLCNPPQGYFVTNNDRVVQLASGRLIAVASYHKPKSVDGDIEAGIESHGELVVFISDDTGKTWREGAQRMRISEKIHSGIQEPGIIQRGDGTLYGWCRTSAGQQWEFNSEDDGETWSSPHPSRFKSPTSPLSLKVIAPGPLWLAIWNEPLVPVENETGFAQNSSWGRTPLVAVTSLNEGRTWSEPVLLEDDPERGFCYTAIHPVGDTVLLAYCCGGRGSAVLQDSCIRRVALASLLR